MYKGLSLTSFSQFFTVSNTISGRGRRETGSRGSVKPHFSGAGSTYGCGPPLFVRISWCMNAADNTFKLLDCIVVSKL